MTKEQALNYLKSSGMSKEQIQAVVEALQESTPKNDLAVDCIDRQTTIAFVCKNTKEILKDTMPLEVKLSNDYLYENISKIMRNPKVLPSVTPIRPKGHWIFEKTVFDKFGNTVECSSCHKKWKTYDEIRWRKENKFCSNCGADMKASEE